MARSKRDRLSLHCGGMWVQSELKRENRLPAQINFDLFWDEDTAVVGSLEICKEEGKKLYAFLGKELPVETIVELTRQLNANPIIKKCL